VAYIVLREPVYVNKAKQIIDALTKRSTWGSHLIKAHISLGLAFCWDVMYDQFTSHERNAIIDAVQSKGNNRIHKDVYANANWTAAAGIGLLSLAFQGDGDAAFNDFLSNMLAAAKENYKQKSRSVLWAHSTDGFPHEGLGYWRKYNHVGLFLKALRHKEPENDWFNLGADYPGSEFLKNAGYARIYAEVDHAEIASLTWADATQVRGKYGNIGALSLVASEYKDGYALDFIDYLIDERGVDFDGEDWATFLFYDDVGIPAKSFRDLRLSRYWPDAEAAIFRSGWRSEDLIFYMKCGSPGGHARRLKGLISGGHDHPDANGFVLFFNNDYLAAEDGYRPYLGSFARTNKKITSGHNTFLIDGEGQKGSGTKNASTTNANMDYLDAEFMGYLLGDASDAYTEVDKFYRTVLYKKHKYLVILDELKDDRSHKYEFLLGADDKHRIESFKRNQFYINPTNGSAKLVIDFVEPRSISSAINQDRIYSVTEEYTDMLRVSPTRNTSEATFLSLLYPIGNGEVEPSYSRILDGDRSGFIVDGNEYYLHNGKGELYTYETVTTDARLAYFKDPPTDFEFLVAGAKEFVFGDKAVSATQPLVAAFSGASGKLRLGKNLGDNGTTTITLRYPDINAVLVDGESVALSSNDSGSVEFHLRPKTFKIGPPGFEQTVTDNYEIHVLTRPLVLLTSPNGGETWEASDSQSILWTSSDSFSQVMLQFSGDGGHSWQIITDSTANDGVFEWTVPDTISHHCLVRISNVEGGFPADVSDEIFSIGRERAMPIVTSFAPTSGEVGAEVTIAGSHFAGTTVVKFNGVPASFSEQSDSQILANVPENANTGKITVTTALGTSESVDVFTVLESQPAVPEITSFTPAIGTVGTQVTIDGHNFSGSKAVSFNGVSANFSVESDSEILATVPDSATTGPIAVSKKDGIATSAEEFVVPSTETKILTFKPTDDAYVWSKKPSTNRGDSEELRVRKTQEEQITYFNFSVKGIKGTVVSGRLRVMVADGTEGKSSVYSASNAYRDSEHSWDEFGLTWLNAPEITGPSLSTLAALEVGDLAEYDVTSALAGDNEYTFALRTGSNDVLKVSSKEGIRAAELLLEVHHSLSSSERLGNPYFVDRHRTAGLPQSLLLRSNYPNPFNPSTRITFHLPEARDVELNIYNVTGVQLRTFSNTRFPAGIHGLSWDGRDNRGNPVSSGVYFYELRAGEFRQVRKMTLLR
jgi:hypothetical protein